MNSSRKRCQLIRPRSGEIAARALGIWCRGPFFEVLKGNERNLVNNLQSSSHRVASWSSVLVRGQVSGRPQWAK